MRRVEGTDRCLDVSKSGPRMVQDLEVETNKRKKHET